MSWLLPWTQKTTVNSMYKLERVDGQEALVTGGLGFFGSNIAHKLAELGARVTIYDACLEPYGWNFANIAEIRDKVAFIKGDTRDKELLKEHVKGKDVIFDCAAQVSHLLSIKNPLLDAGINCIGALNLLEACREVNDSAKVVYPSTRAVTGKMIYSPVDENHPTEPADIYGVSKLAAEKYSLLYHRLYSMKTTVLRVTNSYGERVTVKREDYGLVNWWVRQALLGEQIKIYGEGKQTRDYCYIGDVVDAMLLAAASEKAEGQIFNAASGKGTSIIDLINLIIETAGSSMKVMHMPWDRTRKSIEIGDVVLDNTKIRNVLGWEPRTSLEDGIRTTIEFYRRRLKEYM